MIIRVQMRLRTSSSNWQQLAADQPLLEQPFLSKETADNRFSLPAKLSRMPIGTSTLASVSVVIPTHKVHIYLEYHSVCPHVGIGTPHLLSRKRVFPPSIPPGTKGACEGVGKSQLGRLERKLSTLFILCTYPSPPHLGLHYQVVSLFIFKDDLRPGFFPRNFTLFLSWPAYSAAAVRFTYVSLSLMQCLGCVRVLGVSHLDTCAR